jgi:putative transposase
MPELLALSPNQVWNWDITKLHGSEKWNYFYPYITLDIFSRYVVGWMLTDRATHIYDRALIQESLLKQTITERPLTIHSDLGGPMKSKPVGFLMADLGITKSFSRPQLSNDNPFSEATVKTIKYAPTFPDRFGSKVAVSFCRRSWPGITPSPSIQGLATTRRRMSTTAARTDGSLVQPTQ